jgi:hypothetical protein
MTERPLARYSKLFRSERLAPLLIGFDGIAGFHGVCVQVFAMGGNSSFFLVLGLSEYSTWNAFRWGSTQAAHTGLMQNLGLDVKPLLP